jgi:hypothetical protein
LTREEILAEKARLKNQYGALFDAITAILFRHDPVGINYEHNTDEYEPETRTILPRLTQCTSSSEVTDVVHEEFIRWFGPDTAGPRRIYEQIGTELWTLWQDR